MTTRRIHILFRLAVVAVLALGSARFLLDNLRNDRSTWLLEWTMSSRRYTNRVAVQVSVEEEIEDGCNVFEGRWVWDNASYPLYGEDSCPFLVKQTTCTRNGRSDSFYKNWRWQPHACDLPR